MKKLGYLALAVVALALLTADIHNPPAPTMAHYTAIPSSDTITQTGCPTPPCAFATTLSIPGTNLLAGSMLTVNVKGLYTTTATASPTMEWNINAGSTTGVCSEAVSTAPTTSLTGASWGLQCFIQINTTGSGGTAMAWGTGWKAIVNGTTFANLPAMVNTSPVTYNTSVPETLSITETATMVSGQTFTLQSLDVQAAY